MNPRIRIVVLLFLVGLVFPSAASAQTACPVPDPSPHSTVATDTTAPPTGWQPVSPLDIPLTGADLDQWEYMVDCDPAVTVGPGGSAIVLGDGLHRLSTRAKEAGESLWTRWVDRMVRIDATAPFNTTLPPTTAWQRGPVYVPVTATDATSPVSTEWRVDGGTWTPGNSATVNGTGEHTLETAAVDAAGNRTERNDTVRIDNDLPTDTTHVADDADVDPDGWHDHAVSVPVTGTDDHSGVDHVEWQLNAQTPGSGPEGTLVPVTAHGEHTLRTRVIDEAGNATPWKETTVKVNINGPADTTVVPTGWITAPSTVIDITADDNGGSGIQRIEWRLDGTMSGDVWGTDTTPVTVTGDGVHELEVRITDNTNRVNDWHTHLVKIDTVNPVDTTSVAAGWLAVAYHDVLVRGTDEHAGVQGVEWRLNGGDVYTQSANNHEVRVTGNGVHTLETRIVDSAGRKSGWKAHTLRLDSALPTNTTPAAPGGWRNAPYAVVLNGTDAGAGVTSVNWRVGLEGEPVGPEYEGTRNVTEVKIDQDGEHTLSTRVLDLAGNYSAWRTETIRIDRVLPTDDTVYPSAPVPNRHVITFAPQDDRSGVAFVEHKLDDGPVRTTPSVEVRGEGEHTLAVRVRDNAGNHSAWTEHTVTVELGPDTTDPTDETTIPTAWQLTAYTVTVKAGDDIDGTGIDYVQWRYGDNPAGQGPSGSQFTVSTDGEHDIETRAVDKAGNASEWRRQTLRLDTTRPVDTTAIPAYTNEPGITLQATDDTSGVATLEYKLNNGAPVSVANGATLTLPADGRHRVAHRALDVAGQASAWKLDEVTLDRVAPVNTSAAVPTGWQTTALSLPLTGTDALSGVARTEWRVNGGAVKAGATATVAAEGVHTFETRVVDRADNASSWRSESIRIDRTPPVNTTPVPPAPWRNTNYTTTVTGTDAVSGVQRVEYRLDGGAVVPGAAVSISAEGPHTLATRVVDIAGNASAWRTDNVGIDKAVPTLTVDCGPVAWRNTPALCTVNAAGGVSGLAALTATRDGGAAHAIGAQYAVEADGATTITFGAVDGAGNAKTATAQVRVDRTPPAATVACTAGADTWICTGKGADALSGVAAVRYAVDGAAPVAVGSGGAFSVKKGKVVVYAIDAAGNTGASAPVTLAERETSSEEIPARTASGAILLRKRAKASRLLGQLSIAATATKTTVDLRPLALGKGTFQFVVKVKTDKRSKTFRRTQRARKGYSRRFSVSTRAGVNVTVTVTVRKKAGRRWRTHASGKARL